MDETKREKMCIRDRDGDADERTGRADVAQRTAEEPLIRQDGEGGGAGGFVGGGYFLCPARPLVRIPILRKDFIIDEYQLLQALSLIHI